MVDLSKALSFFLPDDGVFLLLGLLLLVVDLAVDLVADLVVVLADLELLVALVPLAGLAPVGFTAAGLAAAVGSSIVDLAMAAILVPFGDFRKSINLPLLTDLLTGLLTGLLMGLATGLAVFSGADLLGSSAKALAFRLVGLFSFGGLMLFSAGCLFSFDLTGLFSFDDDLVAAAVVCFLARTVLRGCDRNGQNGCRMMGS